MSPAPQGKEDLIKRYIEIGLSRGYSRDQVKQKFMSHGYSGELFEKTYSKYFASKQKARAITYEQKETLPLPPKHRSWRYVFFGALVTLVVFGGLLLWKWPIGTLFQRECATPECFIAFAQECTPTSYTQDVEGTMFLLKVTSDCTLHKEILSFGLEPDAVKQLLEKKSMDCTYEQGMFKKTWVDSLTLDLDQCQGPLKEGLLELLATTIVS